MLGLPKTTELSKQLPKKAIYEKFKMSNAEKERIDADISRITIVNEVSPAKVNVAEGENVKSFFVVQVLLKKKNFSEKSIISISKLIPQNILFVLSCDGEEKLAIYRAAHLMQSEWAESGNHTVQLKGLDFDAVWDNLIIQIGSVQLEQGNTLDEQIAVDDQRAKIEKEIARLEKQARAEKQPKKKFELVEKIKMLQMELE